MTAKPLFFVPNRVWRCYTGGKLLDTLRRAPAPADGNFPEDWLVSVTRALNGARGSHPDEGLSRIRNADGTAGSLLTDYLAGNARNYLGADMAEAGVGVLCKFLDSAVRLPIQCHPDRAFARRYYHSPYGKTEAWIVLDTRAIGGEPPFLLMGFKPGVNARDFARVVHCQDAQALTAMLHRVPVRPGDCYLIPGRLPHAIGPGVFMLEVQEPTDWVIQPERFCAGTELADGDMWGPLSPADGLRCFDFAGAGKIDDIIARTRLAPAVGAAGAGGQLERIIGPERTDCFTIERLIVKTEMEIELAMRPHIGVITEGSGRLRVAADEFKVCAGGAFLLPWNTGRLGCRAAGGLLVIYLITRGENAPRR